MKPPVPNHSRSSLISAGKKPRVRANVQSSNPKLGISVFTSNLTEAQLESINTYYKIPQDFRASVSGLGWTIDDPLEGMIGSTADSSSPSEDTKEPGTEGSSKKLKMTDVVPDVEILSSTEVFSPKPLASKSVFEDSEEKGHPSTGFPAKEVYEGPSVPPANPVISSGVSTRGIEPFRPCFQRDEDVAQRDSFASLELEEHRVTSLAYEEKLRVAEAKFADLEESCSALQKELEDTGKASLEKRVAELGDASARTQEENKNLVETRPDSGRHDRDEGRFGSENNGPQKSGLIRNPTSSLTTKRIWEDTPSFIDIVKGFGCTFAMNETQCKTMFANFSCDVSEISVRTALTSSGEMKKGRKNFVLAVHVQLPEDIIAEILGRLPVKTLLRFKCVCKFWKELISNPNFTLSCTGRDRVIVGYVPYASSSFDKHQLYFYSIDDDLSMVKLPDPVDDVRPYHYHHHSRFDLYGSCNGLVLFLTDNGMYLWNPMTSCCRLVHQLHVLADRVRQISLSRVHRNSGLCYDKKANDYKVVLMANDPPPVGSVYASVVSLRSGKTWTDISFPYKVARPSISSYSGVLVGGHLHWIVEREIGASMLIVYFDEEINQFRELPMPDEHEPSDGSPAYYFGLTLLYGCLCMSKSASMFRRGDIFIMREYGVKQSWTKLFTLYGVIVPLHTKNPNEIILVPGSERQLCRYNLEKNHLRRIKCPPVELRQKLGNKFETEAGQVSVTNMSPIAAPFRFTESLASVDFI
ncbi:OLC1v1035362C1 [Oldenlandia corymbosa var. corymbosa]|uniref:OLC1v1035362C1 n=1 Tax=Oldenlandia corymbosa var. corymbosa TaxID=529605 RepID=A0AAV1CTB4_OLDCO|nr:OLC1v1035362C1 [Oldenlandia corymbosa var. corymbosa]